MSEHRAEIQNVPHFFKRAFYFHKVQGSVWLMKKVGGRKWDGGNTSFQGIQFERFASSMGELVSLRYSFAIKAFAACLEAGVENLWT